jgi:hypothetical protein
MMIFSVIFAVALLISTVYALTYTTQTQEILFESTQDTEQVPISLQPNQTFSYAFTLNVRSFGSGHGYSIGQNETVATISPLVNSFTPHWAKYFSDTELRLNGTYDILISIYDPDENIVSHRQESGSISSLQNLSINFEFTTLGTFTLQVQNMRPEEFTAPLIPHGITILYNQPLFNFGIVGLTLLVLYPIVLLSWTLLKKPKKE